MYKIIALFGESGSGKDYIQKHLCTKYTDECSPIVSYTTRPIRDNEVNGVDYHFTDISNFTSMILNGDMIEATEFNNWFYGTPIASLKEDKINVGVFNIYGIESLLNDRRCSVLPVYVKCSDKTRLMRALNREAAPDCSEVCRRFLADKKDFDDIPFHHYIVGNDYSDSLTESMRDIMTLVKND